MSYYDVFVSSSQFVWGLSIGTLLTQLCKYMGAATTDLLVLPFYFGLLFSNFIIMKREMEMSQRTWKVQYVRHKTSHSNLEQHGNPVIKSSP